MKMKYYLALIIVLTSLILAGCAGPSSITSHTPNPTQTSASPTTTTSPFTAITSTLTNPSTSKLEVYYLDAGQGDSETLR